MPESRSCDLISVWDSLPTSLEGTRNCFSLGIFVSYGGFKGTICLGSLVCKEGIQSLFSSLMGFSSSDFNQDLRLNSHVCPFGSYIGYSVSFGIDTLLIIVILTPCTASQHHLPLCSSATAYYSGRECWKGSLPFK